MDKELKELMEEANKIEARLLLRLAELFDTEMDPCNCNDEVEYNFNNILLKNENTSFCLNCGGFISTIE